jgi:hypothetical protein
LRRTKGPSAASLSIVGLRFGNLVVLRPLEKVNRLPRQFECKCDCGVITKTTKSQLEHGNAKSCGCEKRMRLGNATRRHGLSDTKVHVAWQTMRRRCTAKTNKKYPIYGGRGIKVCERWSVFEKFLEDMGYPPSVNHSIDRIDVNGDYEPGNCRWATPTQQVRNRTNTIFITHLGRTKPLKEWCDELGVGYNNVRQKLYRGISFDAAINKKQ